MSRIRAWTGVFLIFLLGAASGIAAATVFHRKQLQEARRGPFLFSTTEATSRLRSELGLNPEQNEQLEKIAAETRLELRGLHEKTRPQAMAIVHRAGIRVRGFLTPEQSEKFDMLRKRALEKHKARLRSLQRPPPPNGNPPEKPPEALPRGPLSPDPKR